jgi:hypothetical protein
VSIQIAQQMQQGWRKQLKAVITGCANNGSGLIRVTAANHRFSTGQHINITNVVGTVEANSSHWTITVITTSTFDLVGSTFTNAYVSGGQAARKD